MIREIIEEIARGQLAKQELYSVVCNVDSVDNSARSCTCTPVNGGATLEDVRIQASLSQSNGLFIEPVVDSKVVVTFLSKQIAFVSLFTEIENVYLDFNDKVTFNGGANGAMVKIGDLVSRMNLIENKLNTVINTYNAHTHVETGGTTNIPGSLVVGTLTPTVSTDIDNPEILQ